MIEQFTHRGELVLDPFAGSGSTLLAARDVGRSAVGFDLSEKYAALCRERLAGEPGDLMSSTKQLVVNDDARNARLYLKKKSVSLIVTSPPYADLLGKKRKNLSRHSERRKNSQHGRVEQYSQDKRDLGTLPPDKFAWAAGDVFESLLPLLKPGSHCVVNIGNMWADDKRILIHHMLIDELESRGYELRNQIIWDRRKLTNKTGIFGWPSKYITMGTTYEYILDFRRAE